MWIQHKAKDGDTLDKIAKQYKNKDPNAILQYAKNKKFAKTLKAGGALKKGQVVWVLDPKGKCFIVTKNGKKVVLDEKQFKAFKRDVDKKMFESRDKLIVLYNNAVDRHFFQRKVNREHWFVSTISRMNVYSASEPSWKPASNAMEKLDKIVRSRDYAKFKKMLPVTEDVVVKYANDVTAWINGLMNTADSAQRKLGGVRDVGKFCGVLAAVTIAAPATLTAGIVVGAGSSAGIGLLYDGAEKASNTYHSINSRSTREIVERTVQNALAGGFGAAITGKIVGAVKGPFIKMISSNSFIKKQALHLTKYVLPKSVIQKEAANVLASKQTQALVAQATKNGTVHIDKLKDLIGSDRIVLEALTKFLVRSGSGAFSKHFGMGKLYYDRIGDIVNGNVRNLGTSQDAIVSGVLKMMTNGSTANVFFATFLEANMKEFQKDLHEVMTSHVKKSAKKLAK